MERTIQTVAFNKPLIPKMKRVAAYARVSLGKDAMLHSLATQVSYYNATIQSHPDWIFVGVYSDEAKTGTKENRSGFQSLIEDCRDGKIDLVITKSISRFARNTVTLLETVRDLKSYGVDVFFEEQNIHTLSIDGEVMLTILASFAQEESRSCSENCKWRIRKGFEQGHPSSCTMLGYRLVNGQYTVVPDEAEIVKKVFDLYLAGNGLQKIVNILNEEGIPSRKNGVWSRWAVRTILENEKYSGDLKLQKYFISDHLTKVGIKNRGELPLYLIEDDHEPIISKEVFSKVQEMLQSKRKKSVYHQSGTSVFTGLIQCADCGKHYRRKTTQYRIVWCCTTFNSRGKKYCPTSKVIPEETLKRISADALDMAYFDEKIFSDRVSSIEACPNNLLRFYFFDGSEKSLTWPDRSRRESWTEEMRAQARQKSKRKE